MFLVYTTFNHADAKRPVAASDDVPVYEARAVPFDPPAEDQAQRSASIARALTVTQTQVRRSDEFQSDEGVARTSGPVLLADSSRELRGFNHFPNFAGANSYLTLSANSFGISAQSAPSGHMAADAETLTSAPVPEASTWMCGGALFLLVAARGARARWHRNQRRTDR